MKLINRTECPFCKNNQFKSLYQKNYNSKILTDFLNNYYNNDKITEVLESEIYEICECVNCLGLFQKNIPNKQLSFFLYENLISSESSFQKKLQFSSKNFKEYFGDAQIIEGLINKENYKIKILEFGCGWGFWTKFMKSLNFDVETVEISSPRVKYLEKIDIKNYKNMENIEKKYDLIFSNQVLEHIPNPKYTLGVLKEKLLDGGFMFHKFPSTFLFKRRLSKNYIPHKDCAHPLEHINLINKKCFKKMCDLLNMEMIKVKNLNLKDNIKVSKNNFIFNNVILKK